jgi:hypothetical protein
MERDLVCMWQNPIPVPVVGGRAWKCMVVLVLAGSMV